MTHLLMVRDVRRPGALYADVLGGRVVMQDPCIVRLANCRVIMNAGGGPTPDRPDVECVPYEASSRVSSFVNLRVADIDGYRDWRARAAHVLTALVEGRLAEQAPGGRADGR
jgi:hypothetical protein